MHRVLVPGGRVLFSVWKSAGPYNIVVREAFERHVDPETATRYRAARVVPEAEVLHQLLVDAGFLAVQIRSSAMTNRLSPIEAFEQPPRSTRRNALPVKLIDGSLLMGHQYLACALG